MKVGSKDLKMLLEIMYNNLMHQVFMQDLSGLRKPLNRNLIYHRFKQKLKTVGKMKSRKLKVAAIIGTRSLKRGKHKSLKPSALGLSIRLVPRVQVSKNIEIINF